MVLLKDITERKEAAEALERKAAELALVQRRTRTVRFCGVA